MRVFVVGIGNPWASDDGVGAEVIRQLRHGLLAEPDAVGSSIELLTLEQPSLGRGCDGTGNRRATGAGNRVT